MARALIVGCGCRGRELAAALVADGHAVRGTTRDAANLPAIEAAGAEAEVADPDRLATLLPLLEGVSVVCWLMGSAMAGPEATAAIHGPRLDSFLRKLVDTPVRGAVYEAAGSVPDRWLQRGAGIARSAAESHRMRIEVVDRDPADHAAWLHASRAAVGRVLG